MEQYAKATGARILASYREVESGKLADRPELARALSHAKRSKATLVVAKLDRLARNVAFLSKLMEAGVDFIACDNATANSLTIHILAAVAEDEAERISAERKPPSKRRRPAGFNSGSARPGHWKGREDARIAGLAKGRTVAAKVISERASEAYADLLPARKNGETLAIRCKRLPTS